MGVDLAQKLCHDFGGIVEVGGASVKPSFSPDWAECE